MPYWSGFETILVVSGLIGLGAMFVTTEESSTKRRGWTIAAGAGLIVLALFMGSQVARFTYPGMIYLLPFIMGGLVWTISSEGNAARARRASAARYGAGLGSTAPPSGDLRAALSGDAAPTTCRWEARSSLPPAEFYDGIVRRLRFTPNIGHYTPGQVYYEEKATNHLELAGGHGATRRFTAVVKVTPDSPASRLDYAVTWWREERGLIQGEVTMRLIADRLKDAVAGADPNATILDYPLGPGERETIASPGRAEAAGLEPVPEPSTSPAAEADPREEAWSEVFDPRTSGERLSRLATAFPEFGRQISTHPNAFPELLAWIDQYASGDGNGPAETGTESAAGRPETKEMN